MRVECHLDVYDWETDDGTWETGVKVVSDDLHGNRVRLEFDSKLLGVGDLHTLIFDADDLIKAVEKCRND